MLASGTFIAVLTISTVKCQDGGVFTASMEEMERLTTKVCSKFYGKRNEIIDELTAEFKETIVQLKQEFSLRYDTLARRYEESKLSIKKLEQIIESQSRPTSMVFVKNSLEMATEKEINTIGIVATTDMHRDTKFNGEGRSKNTIMPDDTTEKSGHIRKSAHVRNVQNLETESAFSVYLSHEEKSLSHNHILKFDGVVLNNGNDYKPTTGIYTVPVTGIYVFHFYIETYSTEKLIAALMVDGVQQSSAIVEVRGDPSSLSGGNTLVIRLVAGQSVWIENRNDNQDYYGSSEYRLTTFSGYYLR